jgi:hypothetical protein
MKDMKYLLTILLLAVSVGAAAAQEARVPAIPAVPAMPPMPDAKLYTELLASSEKVVKGAPFAADVVNESVQTLADGNRIVRTSNSKMYRDSEGRFRRDGAVNSGGSFGYYVGVLNPSITDPVLGFKYILNDKDKTVRRWVIKTPVALTGEAFEKLRGKLKELSTADPKMSPEARAELEKTLAQQGKTMTIVTTPLAQSIQEKIELEKAVVGKIAIATTIPSGELIAIEGGMARSGSGYAANTEALGTKNIEGVEAEGTRTTTTIPAGAIGNERAIEIVYEKWYSKDLQLIVYSKHSDPRYGDQTYRLTNISRSEPDPSVFAVPTEYKVLTDGYAPAAGSVYKITAATPAKAIFYASDATAPKPPTVTVKAPSAPNKP